MAKTTKNREHKKRELVEIAEKLFINKGFDETNVEDILVSSGLSKGGFYHYFKSKDEVLAESIRYFAEDLLETIKPVIEDMTLNAIEKLKLFISNKSSSQASRRDIIHYMVMLMKSDFTFYKYNIIISQMYIEPLSTIIRQGCEDGLFNVDHPVETADILIRAITSVPYSLFYDDYQGDPIKTQKYKEALEDVITRTLGVQIQLDLYDRKVERR
ncbi:MAG: TetR/AcrR family transcriptional regulator [Clostridiales bacterium]|nr:TetR/AcrR family transcriptional regulator [Clostridiales bacterium]